MKAVEDFRKNIDWSIVVSGLTTAVIVGGTIYAMRKAGLTTAAGIVSAGV